MICSRLFFGPQNDCLSIFFRSFLFFVKIKLELIITLGRLFFPSAEKNSFGEISYGERAFSSSSAKCHSMTSDGCFVLADLGSASHQLLGLELLLALEVL